MEDVIAEFDWYSKRTPNEKCRVSVRQSRDDVRKVHIEAYAKGLRVSSGITFRREELPEIIEALNQAQKVMGE